MGWAENYIDSLRRGETITINPNKGNSMAPHITNGQSVTIEPVIDLTSLRVGDIVLCKVHKRQYLHFIDSIKDGGGGSLIIKVANASGFVNGRAKIIYGKVIEK